MSRKNVVSSSINFVTAVVYVSFLLNLATAVKPRGFSMKMIRSDSKKSPMHLRYANLTQEERFQRLVEQSKARARYFASARAAAYNRSISMNPDIARIRLKYMENRHYYIGEVGIDGLCTYKEGYISGPKISGHLAYETLTMKSNTGALGSVEKIVMGCGIDQRNFGPLFGVPEIREGIADSHTYLRFGFDTIIEEGPPNEILTTPIIQDPNFGTPYHLILKDISIGNRSVGFQQSDFELKPDGTGGTIIDSGAPFTTMRMRHFERVEQVLVEYFTDSGIRPADPEPGRDFDTCFDIPVDFTAFPVMTFHFQDADFVIQHWSAYYIQERLLCFGIIGLNDDDPNDVTLGAMQQANKRILHDLHAKVLKFTDERCDDDGS
ncbi:aspartic proteinase CDR1-like [Papaver somniferum]|uniref:aspartic proteinase CDR1-like n=1 Tax=Papaver somniferum TaxID=3469 RepID=UPI000E701D2C|nr:aspartic proteinase CDR1-like [Papaver somniferum]